MNFSKKLSKKLTLLPLGLNSVFPPGVPTWHQVKMEPRDPFYVNVKRNYRNTSFPGSAIIGCLASGLLGVKKTPAKYFFDRSTFRLEEIHITFKFTLGKVKIFFLKCVMWGINPFLTLQLRD